MAKFQVGDIVRCKKKFSYMYPITGMNALCKVVGFRDEIRTTTFYNAATHRVNRRKHPINLKLIIVGHKLEKLKDENANYDVYDFHYRGATERDKRQFMLYAL